MRERRAILSRGQAQHVAEVARTSLPHSQHQVVHRHGGRGAVVLPSYGMQTTAIKVIDHLSHRSGEGPGCTAVGQGRAHGESPFW